METIIIIGIILVLLFFLWRPVLFGVIVSSLVALIFDGVAFETHSGAMLGFTVFCCIIYMLAKAGVFDDKKEAADEDDYGMVITGRFTRPGYSPGTRKRPQIKRLPTPVLRGKQVALDTETTGLSPEAGHRIIEIGAIEMIDGELTGRRYQQYINPERRISSGAQKVHGITREFLADKPVFSDIWEDFLAFVEQGEVLIHNAPFDVGFIDAEFRRLQNSPGALGDHCTVVDTLALARRLYPRQRNSLDALCERYGIDNSGRADRHGAVEDAAILADVYKRLVASW